MALFGLEYSAPLVSYVPIVPGLITNAKTSPIIMAIAVVIKKKEIVLAPILPNFFGSPSPATPKVIEKKTIGTTSILIKLRKIVPSGPNKNVLSLLNKSGEVTFSSNTDDCTEQ